MKRMGCFVLGTGLLLLLVAPWRAFGNEEVQVSVVPRNLIQGGIALVRVTSPDGAEVTGKQGEHDISFFPSGKNLKEKIGLVPFDLEENPGDYLIRVSVLLPEGGERTIEKKVILREGKFGRRELTLPPHMVNPPESEVPRIVRERSALKKIFETAAGRWKGSGSFVLPFPGFEGIAFGEERILNGERKSPHSGVDCPAPEGTPVRAANSGDVVLAQDLYYEGNTLIIDHGLGVYIIYIHLQKFNAREGDFVRKGEIIGWVGQTGRATGPHLHYGAKILGKRVDPNRLTTFSLE